MIKQAIGSMGFAHPEFIVAIIERVFPHADTLLRPVYPFACHLLHCHKTSRAEWVCVVYCTGDGRDDLLEHRLISIPKSTEKV